MFVDRKDAGEKLAKALHNYKNQDVIVFAIPKGGVEVAYEVAKYLNVQLNLLISRKLPLPSNSETGFGAIAEDSSIFIFDDTHSRLSEEIVEKIITEQQEEIKRRIKVLRDDKPLPNIANRTVILVDDGLAMGSTMRVSIKLCRNKRARKIIVAVPVAGNRVAEEIARLADGIVVLEKPEYFQAVAQVYINWYDVKDSEVISILKKWKNESSM